MKCPHCNYKSTKVDIRTTEIGKVLWIDSQIINGELILGDKWQYEGGFTDEQKPCEVICKKCGEIIKEVE